MTRWLQVVAASLCINTSYGTMSYAFSVLVTERAAGGEFGITLVSVAFGIALLVSGVVALFAGTITDVVGSRRLMIGGAVLGAAGLWVFSLCQDGWQVVVVLACMVGPAMAATFYEPVYVLMNRWFAAHERPRAYGVLTFASGFSITIFVPLTSILVEEMGWRDAVRVLAVILLVVGVVMPWLVLREPAVGRTAVSARTLVAETLRGFREANVAFWLFTGVFFAANTAFSGAWFHAVGMFESRGFDPQRVAAAIALAGIVSLPARLILPALAGRVRTMGLLAVCIGTLGFAALLASVADEWWQVWVYIAVFGAVFGALYPLRALATSELFAGDFYGRLLGTQALFVAAGRALGPALIGLAVGAGGTYEGAFVVAAAVMVASAVALPWVVRESARATPVLVNPTS